MPDPTRIALEDQFAFGGDPYWSAALGALRAQHSNGDSVLAPIEFLRFIDRFYPLHMSKRMIPRESIDWFLLHKGMLDRLDPAFAEDIRACQPYFANEVFVLLGRRGGEPLPAAQQIHVMDVKSWAASAIPATEPRGHAALVKTYERPAFLERTLSSIAPQCSRLLVVDDGSGDATRARNAAAAQRVGAEYIHLGNNHGSACVFNTGVSILLSDLEIGWICVFDDDVELAPKAIERLRAVTTSAGPEARRSLYSGYVSQFHDIHDEARIAGERVLLARSCSSQHLHAHRTYWEAVLPIPTTYHRAPKPESEGALFDGQGSEVDWWCTNWAPHSAIKEGGQVYIVPGLVTTFGQGSSTWGGAGS